MLTLCIDVLFIKLNFICIYRSFQPLAKCFIYHLHFVRPWCFFYFKRVYNHDCHRIWDCFFKVQEILLVFHKDFLYLGEMSFTCTKFHGN
ncbi:hypothetical protein IHE45_15G128400 [Dioscorea alata]|uniref:Uncharacterized protein n=1 Tax=Dioscorea alata TaxID=55571 RepID=A0ACB7UPA2_DIOAL|nr:hypothetical protein IHE45_15G128400 [Dioscorea alata]